MKKRARILSSLLLALALTLGLWCAGSMAEELTVEDVQDVLEEALEHVAEEAPSIEDVELPAEAEEAEEIQEPAEEADENRESEEIFADQSAAEDELRAAEDASDYTYKYVNETYHLFIYNPTGVQRLEQHDDYDEEADAHTGVCLSCGYVLYDASRPCQHPSTSEVEWFTWDKQTITPKGDEGHDITYTNVVGYTADVCDICGETLKEDIGYEMAEGTISEMHEFFGTTTCEVCGYTTTCAHPDSVKLWVYIDTYYNLYDDENHLLAAWWYYALFCPDCGYINFLPFGDSEIAAGNFYECLEVDKTNNRVWASVLEEHAYDEFGLCECGFKDPDWDKPEDEFSYVDIGSQFHLVKNITTGYQYIEYHESDTWEDGVPVGICALCGHNFADSISACGHERTYTWDDIQTWDALTYVNLSAMEHQAIYTNVKLIRYTSCDICGKTLAEEVLTLDTYTLDEAHYYYDMDTGDATDYCTICGQVNTCKHPNLVYFWNTEGAGSGFKIVNDVSHIVFTGFTYNAYCDVCGYYSGVPVTDADVQRAGFLECLEVDYELGYVYGTKVEPHEYIEEGYCRCGYKKSEEPDNAFSVNLNGVSVADSASKGKGALTISGETTPDVVYYARVTWAYEFESGETMAYCAMREIAADGSFEMDSPLSPFGAKVTGVQVAIVTDPEADSSAFYNGVAFAKK